MLAYKGFNKNLESIYGNNNPETCQFTPGERKTVPNAKTAREGFHCCEYIFDCLSYYDINGDNRFFKVEVGGDIDEDERGRIACTEIKLLEEIDLKGMVYEAANYIIDHPHREGWEVNRHNVAFKRDKVKILEKGIAMVRGKGDLLINAPEGTLCCYLHESPLGYIDDARLWSMPKERAGRWTSPEYFKEAEK